MSINCNFCGKNEKEVLKLFKGNEAYICNECVDLCNEITEDLAEENKKEFMSNLGFLKKKIEKLENDLRITKNNPSF
ncbi:MAG: hypothetical protein OXC37_00845 [Bdellovibrionaceae bacterium]|nr:hypothetical protein [Pseudobdellovibrionaceae bacterium]